MFEHWTSECNLDPLPWARRKFPSIKFAYNRITRFLLAKFALQKNVLDVLASVKQLKIMACVTLYLKNTEIAFVTGVEKTNTKRWGSDDVHFFTGGSRPAPLASNGGANRCADPHTDKHRAN